MQPGTDFERYRYGFGLSGRIMYFLELADPRIIFLAATLMVTLVVLALMGKRLPQLLGLLICQVLAGSVYTSLDSAAGVARMAVIALLCLQAFRLKTGPGWGVALFGIGVLIGLPQSVFTRDLLWSIQWGLMLLGTVVVAWVMADSAQTRDDVKKILSLFIVAGLVWTLLGTANLRALAGGSAGGQRLSAMSDSIGVFTDTGGISMPFLLWGALRRWNKFLRAGCGLTFIAATLICISCGQRGGLFAGIVACLPQLARLKPTRLLGGGVIVAAVGLLSVVVLSQNQKHFDFLMSRYFSTNLSNRDILWKDGLNACLESPIIGHGYGSNRREMRERMHAMKGTHNMYLSNWFDTGIIGLIPFVASMVVSAWRAAMLSITGQDRDLQDLARLCLGMIGAVMSAGFFSTWAASPTGLGTVTLLICMALTHRLDVIAKTEATQQAAQQWLMQQQRILAWRRSLQPALVPARAIARPRTSPAR